MKNSMKTGIKTSAKTGRETSMKTGIETSEKTGRETSMKAGIPVKQIAFSGLFAALTAVLSQITIYIPFSPVPVTLQVFSVVLAGAVLGSRLGAISQLVYVLIGITGIPVFAGFEGGLAIIMGHKGGYILGFPVLAFLTGFLAERRNGAGVIRMFLSMAAGLIVFYVIGTTWLGVVLRLSPFRAIEVGAACFLPIDLAKLVLAAVVGTELRKRLGKLNLLPG